MDLGIKGRRALVTGGGRGLGRSIASTLAAEGAHVAVVSRTARDVESLVEEMGGEAAGHFGVAMDLNPDEGPRTLLDHLANDFGPVDIVVHNMGGTLDISDPYCSIADWRRIWRHNIEVALELNLELLPAMSERGWGRAVHISSIAGMENQGPVPYGAIKAALTAYTRSMGRVVAKDGIIMTTVLPGAVFTAGGYWDSAATDRPEHVNQYLEDRMAIHRFGRPDEIGGVVTFLCSELASFCVGSIIPVDGGQGRSYFGQ
jgi:NAD(P)-dependent dehydrogenase (short-subunit alcohol dehydrogenase family)